MAHEFANQCLLTPSVSFDHSINSSAFALMAPRAYREKTGGGVYKKFGKQGREYFKLVPIESSTKRGFKGGKDDLDPSPPVNQEGLTFPQRRKERHVILNKYPGQL